MVCLLGRGLMEWGLGSLIPVGSDFFCCFFEGLHGVGGKSALPFASSPGIQQLQPGGHRELGLQNATSPSWRCEHQGRSSPTPLQSTVCPITPNRSRAGIPIKSPGKAPLPLLKASCSPSWKRGGSSLSALRANNSHQLIALFPRAAALAAGSQLAGGY